MQIPDVIIETWPNMVLPQSEVKAVLQYLAHKAKKPVTFRWYAEDEGYSDQSVSVRVFVNDDLAATYNPSHVMINGQSYAVASVQRGMAAALVRTEWTKIADEEGQLIGCVDHNRIILPLEITVCDNDAARAILAYVVEKAVDLLDFDVADMVRKREEDFARHFGEAFRKSVKTRLESRQEEFDTRKREAEQAYYSVLEFERDRPVLEEELAFLTGLAEKSCARMARRQVQALLQVQSSGQYTHIAFDGEGVLRATTAPVTIEHEGYEIPLGRYEVEIPATGDIRIKALDDHPNADHPHPHVAHDNRPCLGNISGDVAKLIGKMRYAETLQLLHSFLSAYNPENPYEKIGHFDPLGRYEDEESDPCEDCDDKASPYCIFGCEHNNECYTCADCYDLRAEYCFEECEHNADHERFHPCEACARKGEERCYLECRYNKEWELQNPCDACEEEECTHEECPYFTRKKETEHAQAT